MPQHNDDPPHGQPHPARVRTPPAMVTGLRHSEFERYFSLHSTHKDHAPNYPFIPQRGRLGDNRLDMQALLFFPTAGSQIKEIIEINGALIARTVNARNEYGQLIINQFIDVFSGSGAYANFVRVIGSYGDGFSGDVILNDINPLIPLTQSMMLGNAGEMLEALHTIVGELDSIARKYGIVFNPEDLIVRSDQPGQENSRKISDEEWDRRFHVDQKPGIKAPNDPSRLHPISQFRDEIRAYFNRELVACHEPGVNGAQQTPIKNDKQVRAAALFYMAQWGAQPSGVISHNALIKSRIHYPDAQAYQLPLAILRRNNTYKERSNISLLTNKLPFFKKKSEIIADFYADGKLERTFFSSQDGFNLARNAQPNALLLISGHFSNRYQTLNEFSEKIIQSILPAWENQARFIIINRRDPVLVDHLNSFGFRTMVSDPHYHVVTNYDPHAAGKTILPVGGIRPVVRLMPPADDGSAAKRARPNSFAIPYYPELLSHLPGPSTPRERRLSWHAIRERQAQAFSRLAEPAGARVRHAPQSIWLENDTLLRRRGLCTGLALAWTLAPAMASGVLFDNLFTAAAHPDDPSAQAFRQHISVLHQSGFDETGSRLQDVGNWDQAVNYLASGSGESRLLVHVGNHSVGLSAHGAGEARRFAVFDPNLGLVDSIADASALRRVLDEHFTPVLRQLYQFDGSLQAHVIGVPVADSFNARVLQLALNPISAGDAPHPAAPSPVSGAQAGLPRATLSRVHAGVAVAGTGLRMVGVFRSLLSIRDAIRQGNGVELGLELGNLGAQVAGEGAERGLGRLGAALQRTSLSSELQRVAQRAISVLPAGMSRMSFGAMVSRGAGFAGNLLSLPFDLYFAISHFGKARLLRGLARQDALFGGSMATIGAASGLLLASAMAAGASLAATGPVGLAVGAAMLVGMQIYSAVRRVQEVKQWIRLTTGEEAALGFRGFFGQSAGADLDLRVQKARYESLQQQEIRHKLGAQGGQSLAMMLVAEPRLKSRALRTACNDDHLHEHLLVSGHFKPTQWKGRPDRERTEALACPRYREGHVHSEYHGDEIHLSPSDDVVDISRSGLGGAVGNGLADGVRAVFGGPVIAAPTPVQTAGAGDDILLFNAHPDPVPGAGLSAGYRIDGGDGNDTLMIEADLKAARAIGYHIDLADRSIKRIHDDFERVALGRIANVENLYLRPLPAGGARSIETLHHFYGDEHDNLLVGGGADRLYGRGGNDTFQLSGSACADGGPGNDLYLVEPLGENDHPTIDDSGDPAGQAHDQNVVYLGMGLNTLHSMRIVDRTLVVRFVSGATLTLRYLYEQADGTPSSLRAARFALITREGWSLHPTLPVELNHDQDVSFTARLRPGILAELMHTPGVQRLIRLNQETDKAVLFNLGDGNDILTGDTTRRNIFVLGRGTQTATGGAGDDAFNLRLSPHYAASGIAAYDDVTRRLMAQHIATFSHDLDGGAGNDTLLLETLFAGTDYHGYRIDLAQQRIEMIAREGERRVGVGRVQNIENIAAGAGGTEITHHQLFGDDRDNMLTGAGQDRLYGRAGDDQLHVSGRAQAWGGEGDDVLRLSGSAIADGENGNDLYQVEYLAANDHAVIQDTGQDDASGRQALAVRLNFGIRQIHAWTLKQRDLVLTLVSGGTLTVKDLYRARDGQNGWTRARVGLTTRDGFFLDPLLPLSPAEDGAEPEFPIAAHYTDSADAIHTGEPHGIGLDLGQRTLSAVLPAAGPAIVIEGNADAVRFSLRYAAHTRLIAGSEQPSVVFSSLEFIVQQGRQTWTFDAMPWLMSEDITLSDGRGTLHFKPGSQPLLTTRSGDRLSWIVDDAMVFHPSSTHQDDIDEALRLRRLNVIDSERGSGPAHVRYLDQCARFNHMNPYEVSPQLRVEPGSVAWQLGGGLALDRRYRLMGVGTAQNDVLTASEEDGAFNLLLGRDGDDRLIASRPGAMLSGDEGADRYQIALPDLGEAAQDAVYVNNHAEDGLLDTLAISTPLGRERVALSRVDDDLWLSVTPEGIAVQPGIVVLDYYRQSSQRHLALELNAAGVTTTISDSELARWALSPDTRVLSAPPGYAGRLDRLVQHMASFEMGGGEAAGASLSSAMARPPVLLNAA